MTADARTRRNQDSSLITVIAGGLLTASGLAVMGLVVLPYRRSVQKAEFRRRVEDLRKHVDSTLTKR
jgi:uncharacterized protein (DUF3084 family)